MNLQTKLIILLISLSLVTIITMGILSTIVLDDYFYSRIVNELKTQADQIEFFIRTSIGSDTSGYSKLQQFSQSAKLRLTLIDKEGTVCFESELPYNQLTTIENHLQRPEVQQALREEIGTSIRHSTTLNTDMLYLAKTISSPFSLQSGFSNVKILRVGVPLTQIQEVKSDIRYKILITGAIVLAFIIGITYFTSSRFSKPLKTMAIFADKIRSGDLKSRIPVPSTSEFKQLAETLNSMLDKLEKDIKQLKKLEHVRSEFLGNVSHELRTPIFAIQGMLETLLGGAIEDKTVNREFIKRALHNTQRLNTLLSDLIEISRIETGEMKMSFRYFNLFDFLTPIINDMQSLASQKNILINFEPEGENIEVYGDPDRIKQVVINLIDNAIKYNKPNGFVKISYKTIDTKVKITIEDSGIGISEEHLPRIFERFYRVDKERSRESGGTGLGLAIVKHIIEAHGSKVDVQSEVDKGSVFSFSLKM